MLRGCMLFVWDGNHWTMAWMELIHEKYGIDMKMHIRMAC